MPINGKVRKFGNGYKITLYLGKDENGRYVRKTRNVYVSKKSEAEAIMREMIAAYENVNTDVFTPCDTPLNEYLIHWIDNIAKPDLERNTYESYRWEIEKHINPVIGHIPLGALTVLHIQEFYSGKIEHGRLDGKGGLSPRSVKYLHSILHQALSKAVDLELIDKNPCDKVKPPKDKRRSEEKIKALDPNQLAKLLETAKDHRDYPLIFTAAYTGLRQSELLALTWDKVSFDKKCIRVEQSLKLLESGEFSPGRTKNESSTRTVDISERVVSVLKEHKKRQSELQLKGEFKNIHNLVFPDTNGNYMNRKNLAHRFRNLADKAGFKDFTFHGLRHTHASILLSNGVYVKAVSERLGHADVDTTLRIYAHLLPKDQRQIVDNFDRLMKQK